MARTTPRRSSATKSQGTTTKNRTVAQPSWRNSVEQIVSLGKGAVDVVQRRGAQALTAAQRRSSALTFKARQAAEQRLETVAVKAIGAWNQVEQVATDRVGRTLNRLGVPSQKDIDKLTRSVAKLSSQIDKLSATATAKPVRAAVSKPANTAARTSASAQKRAPAKRAAAAAATAAAS